MPQNNELRVFISSTFRDLGAEREHLVKKIFPEIRALCRERGVTFTEIDLRWGLTDSEAESGRVVRICLEEIDRCRPFFIGIIGSRYGWQPDQRVLELDPRLINDFPWISEAFEKGLSVTEMEFLHGVLAPPQPAEVDAWFYRRNETGAGSDAPTHFASLLQRVETSGFPVVSYNGPIDLGEHIRNDLLALIDARWPVNQTPSELELERRAHHAFARSRRRGYIPQPTSVQQLLDWSATSAGPMVLRGDSGLGKSALLAFIVEEYRKNNPRAFIIEHYVGSSRTSGSRVGLMRHLMQEIQERFSLDESIPTSAEAIERDFSSWLFRAEHLASNEGVAFFVAIDALNNLDEAGRRLAWLPKSLPPALHLLVSTTPSDVEQRLLERNYKSHSVLPLRDIEIRREIVAHYLDQFHKTIPEELIDEITSDPKGESPLYLRLVAEQLRKHGTHETLHREIARYSSAKDIDEAFQRTLDQLGEDFGRDVIGTVLSALWTSRSGLTETELRELTKLTPLALSPLLFALDFHLLRREGMLAFSHDYLRRAVEQHYCATNELKNEWHRKLASYFNDQEPSERSSAELAWQLNQAEDRSELARLLANVDHFTYLYRKERELEVLEYWGGLRGEYNISDAYRSGLERWRAGGQLMHNEFNVLAKVADLLKETGEWPLATELVQERYVRAVAAGDQHKEAQAHLDLANLYRLAGDYEQALHEADEGMRLFKDLDDPKGLEACIGTSAIIHLHQGQFDAALKRLQEAEEIARVHGRIESMINVLGNMAVLHLAQGRHHEGLRLCERVAALCREIGDYRGHAMAIGNMGHAYSAMRQFDRALECHRKDEAQSRTLGDLHGLSRALSNISTVLIQSGRYVDALAQIEEHEAIDSELGDRNSIAMALGNKGVIHTHLGRFGDGLQAFEQQEVIYLALNKSYGLTKAMGNIADVYRMMGDYESALGKIFLAIEESRKTNDVKHLLWSMEIASRTLLEIVQSCDQPPSNLVDVFPEVESTEWKHATLVRAAEMATECQALARDQDADETRFSADLLVACLHYERAMLNSDKEGANDAVNQLRLMLSKTTDNHESARLHYMLWKFREVGHAEYACRLYEGLLETTPNYLYQQRIDELGAAGSSATTRSTDATEQ